MSQQQQQAMAIQPPLSELDTPPVEQKPDEQKEPTLDKNPTNTPPADPAKTPTVEDNQESEEEEPKEGEETETTEEGDVTPEDFWAEVGKLRGDDFKFEFPQDIEDPLAPQAVHHIIKTAEDRAVESFEESMSKRDPRGYAYLLHRANGGDDESFFAQKTEVLPDLETLKGSVDLQQAFYKRALTRKGIDAEDADTLVAKAIEKNKLFGLVEAEHKATQKAQEDQLLQLQKINEENQRRTTGMINKMAATLQERILQNKGLDITIPDAKRAEFLQFVNSALDLDPKTGRWFVSQEITSDNMAQVLGALYYSMVKGNMDEIITNKANQKAVQKFRLKMQSDKTKKSTAPDPDKKTNQKPGVGPAISEL